MPTPTSITLPRDAFRELGANGILEEIADEFTGPLVVKPAQGGSAQGVTMVDDRSLPPRAMVDAYTYWDVALIEQKITGTEIAVGIIDSRRRPGRAARGRDRAAVGRVQLRGALQRRRDPLLRSGADRPEIAARAAEVALDAHRALGMRHLSRIDLIVDGAGTPWFLEANVLPGLTETSILPQALEAAGHDLGWVYSALAEAAIAEAAAHR